MIFVVMRSHLRQMQLVQRYLNSFITSYMKTFNCYDELSKSCKTIYALQYKRVKLTKMVWKTAAKKTYLFKKILYFSISFVPDKKSVSLLHPSWLFTNGFSLSPSAFMSRQVDSLGIGTLFLANEGT